jgi:hypothetical protein
MVKQMFNINKGIAYINTFRQHNSLMVWLDGPDIAAWTDNMQPERRGSPPPYTAICSIDLMMKYGFYLLNRVSQGFVCFIFTLIITLLSCPHHSLLSKRAKTAHTSTSIPTRGAISHSIIDATGLKVFGEGEWKAWQHVTCRYRIWHEFYLIADIAMYEFFCADLSLSGPTDSPAMPGLIN